jgi:hypothetical protein
VRKVRNTRSFVGLEFLMAITKGGVSCNDMQIGDIWLSSVTASPGLLLGVHFDSEDGGEVILCNVRFSPNYRLITKEKTVFLTVCFL